MARAVKPLEVKTCIYLDVTLDRHVNGKMERIHEGRKVIKQKVEFHVVGQNNKKCYEEKDIHNIVQSFFMPTVSSSTLTTEDQTSRDLRKSWQLKHGLSLIHI